MFVPAKSYRQWSELALRAFIVFFVGDVLLCFVDGLLVNAGYESSGASHVQIAVLTTIARDFRYLCEQMIFCSAIVFVGAKLCEARTTLTIGFDKIDVAKMVFKGPDDDNVVWLATATGLDWRPNPWQGFLKNASRKAPGRNLSCRPSASATI